MPWKVPTLASVVNQWSMNTDTMGVYGNYYLKRAIIAQSVSARTFPKTPSTRSISATTPASHSTGASKYTIHFDKGATPPANAFWSITLYTARVSSREQSQPVRRQQLDAVPVQL